MIRLILITIISLFFYTCDEPQIIICSDSGFVEDDCGDCRVDADDSEWNGNMDLCGFCYGVIDDSDDCLGEENTECCGCIDASATNYNMDASINNGECTYNPYIYQIIDLKFLTESFCVSTDVNNNDQCAFYSTEATCDLFNENYGCMWTASHETKINLPIYWNNTSDIDIEIYSIDTTPDYCIENITTDQDTDCSIYENHISCDQSECTWVISPTYNQFWDNFEMMIPTATEGFPTNFYFEPGFYVETEETYCSQINGEERCGTIVVTSTNND